MKKIKREKEGLSGRWKKEEENRRTKKGGRKKKGVEKKEKLRGAKEEKGKKEKLASDFSLLTSEGRLKSRRIQKSTEEIILPKSIWA